MTGDGCRGRVSRRLRRAGGLLVFALAAVSAACLPPAGEAILSEFDTAVPVTIDGRGHLIPGSLASLGALESGRVLRLHAQGDNLEAVLVLRRDNSEATATAVGGGPAGAPFEYRVQMAGEHLLYLLPEAASVQSTVLTVGSGDPAYAPPSGQVVRVVFEPDFLTNPGLTDPGSFTADQVQLVADLEPLVRAGVLAELRRIFAGTPVEIVDESEPAAAGPFSTVTFSPQRVVADPGIAFDAALPDVEPGSPCAAEPVIFGELLPRGLEVDTGNRNFSDAAKVYVGSFQGRGPDCQTAVLGSLDNIILALAHTGAHEIGHLVGLYHTALVDIMDRRPTAAFQRDLGLARGQLLLEIQTAQPSGGVQVEPRVVTSIYQDPDLYFQAAFGN